MDDIKEIVVYAVITALLTLLWMGIIALFGYSVEGADLWLLILVCGVQIQLYKHKNGL